jgi:hypothetical protein
VCVFLMGSHAWGGEISPNSPFYEIIVAIIFYRVDTHGPHRCAGSPRADCTRLANGVV